MRLIRNQLTVSVSRINMVHKVEIMVTGAVFDLSANFFLKQHFRVLETNLSNYRDRQIAESLHISTVKPTLNIQGTFRRLETLR